MEQPTPPGAPARLGVLPRIVPVLADESVATIADLPGLLAEGWSGLVLKAPRGQSASLLSHAWARAHDRYVATGDLTAVGPSLRHSARLAVMIHPDADGFEYNSRQYAPDANRDLATDSPRLVAVSAGFVDAGPPPEAGLC